MNNLSEAAQGNKGHVQEVHGTFENSNHCFKLSSQRLKLAIKPHREWGPALNANRVMAGYAPLPGHGSYDENIDWRENCFGNLPIPQIANIDEEFYRYAEFESKV